MTRRSFPWRRVLIAVVLIAVVLFVHTWGVRIIPESQGDAHELLVSTLHGWFSVGWDAHGPYLNAGR